MDIPVIEVIAQAPEILRDNRGIVVGKMEVQQLTGRMIARDARGVIVGSYDLRTRETRDRHGRVIGRGNLLPVLLMQAR